MLKRTLDFSLALLLMILGLPFLPFVVLLTWIISGRQFLLSLPRVGKNGKLLGLYVFNAPLAFHPVLEDVTVSNNNSKYPRAQKLVAFSKLHLWPMLFNVLKGDLSLVGPTPEPPEIADKYTDEQKRVLSVRPGLLGSSYFYDTESLGKLLKSDQNSMDYYVKHILSHKLKRELRYLDDRRIGKDFRIVIKSIFIKLRNIFLHNIKSGVRTYNFLIPIDVILIFLSYLLAYNLRFEWNLSNGEYRIFFLTMPVVLTLRILCYERFGMYKNIWKYVSIRDLVKIIQATTVSSVLIATSLFFLGVIGHSRSVFLIDWMFCISLIGGFRLVLRLFNESINLENKLRKNVLIIGAGDVGEMLLRELERNARDKYNVVGFIDDNKEKHGMTVHSVRVLGGREKIPEMVELFRVDEVFIAIALISSDEIKSIINYCNKANVRHRIVPAVSDLLNGSSHISKIRKVEISDLFGRMPVQLDISAIQNVLSGKRVLVTGAGGSIGSELCRQIVEFNPESLILVDKNENYLHEIRCELQSASTYLDLVCYLGDITDNRKQKTIFENFRPEIVFHAAAQKHVPLGEENPDEAIWTNIYGTQNIANLTSEYKASHFILVSTDKAVNPTSIMGVTKRIAELCVQARSSKSQTKFITVRFGNVLNSNGSVVPTFLKQIERGGPITITHPDIERYFMSIDEAVQLILQSVSMGENGQIFILDMGRPIKIVTLAEELIRLMGAKPYDDIDIEFIGLRPGEKLFEELVGKNEQSLPTLHSNIKTLQANSYYPLTKLEKQIDRILMLAKVLKYESLTQALRDIVPEYTPNGMVEVSSV